MCITDESTAAGVSKKGRHSAEFTRSFCSLLFRAAGISLLPLMVAYSA
jgi:hypothetical protein